MDIVVKQKIQDIVHKLSKYSVIYHSIVIITLLFFQSDIFKESFPKEYIVDGIIAISSFVIGTIMLDKILSKKINDAKPFLYCPECKDVKMRTKGEWVCGKCKKTFGISKKE